MSDREISVEFGGVTFVSAAALERQLRAQRDPLVCLEGDSPLGVAAKQGFEETFDFLAQKVLLQKRSGDLDKKRFQSAICDLSMTSRPAYWMRKLQALNLRLAADPSQHTNGVTALAICIGRGDLEATGLLLEAGCSVHHPACSGLTPLQLAIGSTPQMVQLLLDAGAALSQRCKHGEYSPCLFASQGGCMPKKEVVRYVIEKGATPTGKNPQGVTPLQAAVEAWKLPMFEALFEELKTTDLDQLREIRPKIQKHMRAKSDTSFITYLDNQLLDVAVAPAPVLGKVRL